MQNMGHLAAAQKRSHQWCVSLTPSNTKTIGRMTCLCFLRPAPTLNILGANKVNYGKSGSGKLLPEEPQGSLLLVQREA